MLEDELEILKDTYPELKYTKNPLTSLINGEILIKPQSANNFVLKVGNSIRKIAYFPPITLYFQSNENSTVDIQIETEWLLSNNKTLLCEKFSEYSNENSILWDFIFFLEKESLDFMYPSLKLEYNFDDAEVNDVLDFWIEYENNESVRKFKESIITCSSCLVPKRGNQCLKTHCNHVFCKNCARDFFDTVIKQGLLDLKCLECSEELGYQEIKSVMNKTSFSRWDSLKFNRFLKKNAVDCPRCHLPVLKDDGKLGSCAKCYFSFCIICKKVYHGEGLCENLLKERKRIIEKSIEEFHPALKARVIKFIDKNAPSVDYDVSLVQEKVKEAFQSEIEFFKDVDLKLENEQNIIRTEYKCCSECGEAYTKTEGCNKMTCGSCGAYFCNLCFMILPKDDPYRHFQKLNGCQLFDYTL